MTTFLKQVAKDLYNRFEGNFEDVTVLFPNKRAGLFFNQALCELAENPIWSPRYMTINELFQEMSGKDVTDDIILVYYLYKSFIKVTGQTNLSFDKFFGWGEVLLNDFQDVDNNMVDAQSLFINVADIEELKRFDYLTEEQITAIRTIFKDFNTDDTSELHRRFMEVWKKMYEIYCDFRESLTNDGYAYDAMNKREIAEAIFLSTVDGQQSTASLHSSLVSHLSSNKYVVVGFNVLNKTEEILFHELKQNGALFYWDYDADYIHDEAASFIEENLKKFPNSFSSTANSLNSQLSTLNYITASTDTAQATYAGEWLKGVLKKDEPQNETAVVLCDESILQPLLHSIPSVSADGEKTVLNITMGYPMNQTAVAGFLLSLLELQEKGEASSNRWRYTYVANVLKHPYTRRISGDKAEQILTELRSGNIAFPPKNIFEEDEFLKYVFSIQDATGVLQYLSEVICRVSQTFTKDDSPLDREALYTAHTIVNRLITLKLEDEVMDKGFLIRLIRQLLDQRSIPFHGEPAVGVQVMGVLETRNLDFKNIIMLSTNEGMLPKISRSSSFIPYTLRQAHDMTTIEKQASLYAYYFYRLLQRAENVQFVYNNYTEGLKKGEPSRFLLQLKYESKYNIVERNIESSCSLAGDTVVEIKKTDEIMAALPNHLSPTALNTYIDCPMRFYLQYVAGMTEEDEVTEEVGKDVFGNIFHKAMQMIYERRESRVQSPELITREECVAMSEDSAMIDRVLDEAFALEFFNISEEKAASYKPDYNGEQLLNKLVIRRYIVNQLKYDATLCPMRILKLEDRIYTKIGNVRVGGIIDRMDEIHADSEHPQIRMVDYKTSLNIKKADSIEELFTPSDNRAGYIFQIFYYCDILDKKLSVAPTLMYVKHTHDTEADFTVKIGKDAVTDYNVYREEFHERLCKLIEEIYDAKKPFSRTEHKKNCEYCPFTVFCN